MATSKQADRQTGWQAGSSQPRGRRNWLIHGGMGLTTYKPGQFLKNAKKDALKFYVKTQVLS